MRRNLFIAASWARFASANIAFNWIQPTCEYNEIGYQGCLRGQICNKSNVCVPDFRDNINTFHPSKLTTRLDIQAGFRTDGRCGKDFGEAQCDPEGVYGGCCSYYGYCGKTYDHCAQDKGCQNGCTTPVHVLPSSTEYTTLISSPNQEPVIELPTQSPLAKPSGQVTTDGSCGATNNGVVCGRWNMGSCCSMYGYCGNTSAHCGDGCQSGPCIKGAAIQAPLARPAPRNAEPGSFTIKDDSGVPVMHAGLLPNGRVAFIDKVENFTKLSLSSKRYAYAGEYDPASGAVVGLSIKTNPFCTGGLFLADGSFLSVGGNGPLPEIDPTVGDGFAAVRLLKRSATDPSLNGKDWIELQQKLSSARWYPSVQILADGSLFVASGSLNGLDPTIQSNNNPTYEILSSKGIPRGTSIPLDVLVRSQPYYMYPFIHLLSNGNLFIFASKSADIFNANTGSTVARLPDLLGDYRTYPNTGCSVLLPLSSADDWSPEIIICGGGAYQDITSPTDPSCGRIKPLDLSPKWEMDAMPEGRSMVEGTLLPDGSIIFLNGASRGAQGFGLAADPVLAALLYEPSKRLGERWTTLASSEIPRLYHSVALLLLDGTLLVAGSNPVEQPILQASASNPYVTEFRTEVYTPPYISGEKARRRPTNVTLSVTALKADGSKFSIRFVAPSGAENMKVALYYGGFVTHSLHMGHRMLFLDNTGWQRGVASQSITCSTPPNGNLAPPGPYVVYVVVDGVPSIGQFVMVS